MASLSWLVAPIVHPRSGVGEVVLVVSPGEHLLVRGNSSLEDGLTGGYVREPLKGIFLMMEGGWLLFTWT